MNRPTSTVVAGIILSALTACLPVNPVAAQSRPVSAQEYIQSTSPLPDGGSVISRSVPGQNVQTIVTIAQLPAVSSNRPPVAGYEPRNSGAATTSTLYGSGNSFSVPFFAASSNATTYPYPAQIAANPFPPSNLSTNYNYTAYRQTPTLGLGTAANSPSRLAQNCPTCVGGQTTAYQTPNYNPVPDLNIQVPGQTPAQPVYQPNFQYQPNLGTPQYGAQGATWYTPFVTGSGVYTPLIRFRNLPPGTYLGQGLIGQPTAFVDGQPIRNLIRYVSP